MMKKRMFVLLILSVLALALVACGGAAETPTPTPTTPPTAVPAVEPTEEVVEAPMVTNAVTVSDQAFGPGNSVTIDSVVSDTDGWLVIHAQADGGPGPILGYAAVSAGENSDVMVELDASGATSTLYAMLHVDAGTIGEYEFPGADGPAMDADGRVVTPAFALSLPTVMLGGNDELGSFLIGNNGLTLYLFTRDDPGVSNCYDRCATAWPPLLVEDGETPTLADGIAGEISTTEREDGTIQVVYNDWPLYFWVDDEVPGDSTGQDVGNVWFVLAPKDPAASEVLATSQALSEANTVTIASVTSDGPGWIVIHSQADGNPGPVVGHAAVTAGQNRNVVVDIDPMAATDTLYAMLHVDAGTAGEYEFPGDDGPAVDADGNVLTPPFSLRFPTVMLGGNDELGEFLVASNRLTLYLFTRDDPGVSNCYDRCAVAWPPLLVEEDETPTLAGGLPGELGTTERDDGTIQVTYNDWPLYYWVDDEAPGDSLGQDVGNVWFVLPPMDPAANDVLANTHSLGEGNTVIVASVTSEGPGWIVIHTQVDGAPGPVIGHAAVAAGQNRNVMVEIDPMAATDTLYAMLHVDAGSAGEYEFPGDDGPATDAGGNVITPAFTLRFPTVMAGGNDELGQFLVGPDRMTLYLFTPDEEDVSTCYDQCAVAWPPLLVDAEQTPRAGSGVAGELATTERDDGTIQVTYNGWPLYYWMNDEAPGDATGQGVNDVWFVVEP